MHIVAKSVMWRQPALPKQMFFMDKIAEYLSYIYKCSTCSLWKHPFIPLNSNRWQKSTATSTQPEQFVKKNNNWHCIENLNNSLVKIIDCKQLNIVVFYVCVCFDNPMWTCTFQLGLIDLDERTHRCGYKSFDDLVLGGKSATLFNFFVWCLKGMSNCNSWAEF